MVDKAMPGATQTQTLGIYQVAEMTSITSPSNPLEVQVTVSGDEGAGLKEQFIKQNANNGSSKRIPPLKKPNDTLMQSNKEKAELLCDAFFPPPPALALPKPKSAPQITLPQWTPYSIRRVSNAVGHLKHDKAPGPDDIPNAAIQEVLPAINHILKNVFNAAIQLWHIPKQWKELTTVVLQEPGKPAYNLAKAYQPIALLNTLRKLLSAPINSAETSVSLHDGTRFR
ncbi:related to reverse transcriptase, putative-Talaromyces stipitatus [Serendipita indica DSM 11827]|uniref:Related to reverse transcriptase, putative-Talaromyces stipitatus n=1 Tax=Serendipita indica (strain DSM 11827) TaxID=1109443 RepID=G4TMN4_SERID|nr:related to reverse transcriptase, putative-Talaromyces stipitatus [Serendipita indica DSM 11827]